MEIVWSDVFSGVTFKIATENEREQALERRARIYDTELGAQGTDEFDTDAVHLVAIDTDGRVVSALRVITQRPFEIESYLDLETIADTTLATAQTGGFWVDNEWRIVRQRRFLQVGMMKLAFMFGRSHGITQFVMYTYDRLTNLYRAAFFDAISISFCHPVWGHVRVMRLNLPEVMARCAHSQTFLSQLILADRLPNFRV